MAEVLVLKTTYTAESLSYSSVKIERSESESGSFLCDPKINCKPKKKKKTKPSQNPKDLVGFVYLSSSVSGFLKIKDTKSNSFVF